LAMWIRRLVR